MSRFNSILLPLDGSPEAARGAGCALWLSEELGASLHVLHAAAQPLAGQDALTRLNVPTAGRGQVVLHQIAAHADAAMLEAIVSYNVDIVVMSARGTSASAGLKMTQRLGTVAQTVIEHSPVPVLLLPVHYRETLPWTSMLAAASGEMAADHALEAATQLAAALRLKVTVVHVGDGPRSAEHASLGVYSDAVHHEYPLRMEELVKRGLMGCTSEECYCVEQVLLRRGDPAAVLLEQVKRHASSVLSLGWHGEFGIGRALVFKRLLEEAECALLVARKTEKSMARLKVGREIND